MDMKRYFTKILITEDQIIKKTKTLASWVNKTYKDSSDLILVGLLKGSIPFLAELIKNVNVLHTMDFMTVSTFDGGMSSTGNLKIIMDLKSDIYKKDVLIVEDIVDSGLTLSNILKYLKARKPKSIRVLTLMDKPSGRKHVYVPDKVGFKVPDAFLAGYGLDVKGKLRNVPYIGIFDKDKFDEL